jgi:hypothetical protein
MKMTMTTIRFRQPGGPLRAAGWGHFPCDSGARLGFLFLGHPVARVFNKGWNGGGKSMEQLPNDLGTVLSLGITGIPGNPGWSREGFSQ